MIPTIRLVLFALVITGLSGAMLVLSLVQRWTRSPVLSSFMILLGAATGVVASMLVSRFRLMVGGLPVASVLDLASNILFLTALPSFVFRAIGRSPSHWFSAAYGLALALATFACAGMVLGAKIYPGFFLAIALGMTSTLAIILWRGLSRIGDLHQLKLTRRFLIATGLLAPLVIFDSVGHYHGWGWIEPLHLLPGELYLGLIAGGIIQESGSWLLTVAKGKIGAESGAGEMARGDLGSDVSARLGEGDLVIPELSPRQREIAGLIIKGYSAKEIALVLDISIKTAENHTYALYRKLGAHNRIQFYGRARQLGIPEKGKPQGDMRPSRER